MQLTQKQRRKAAEDGRGGETDKLRLWLVRVRESKWSALSASVVRGERRDSKPA